MAISQDIKERIFAVADSLYSASEIGEFPNVDAVRQKCHVSMNSVVEGMKEWRQQQRKQAQVVHEPLPAELQSVVQNMAQNIWETARQLAKESLNAAKVAFEAEKNDLIQLSNEQSESFEAQAKELEVARVRITELEQQIAASAASAQEAIQQLEKTRTALIAAEQQSFLAETKSVEIELRAKELRAELDRAHETLDATEKAHKDQLEQLGNESKRTMEQLTATLSERNQAQMETAKAREELARLAGRLDAMTEQNATLLALKTSALESEKMTKGKK
jgi:chromosome segregation ATPase